MTQYNTYVKLSSSQLIKLKSAIKNGTKVTLNLSLNVIRDSNSKNNFPHKLLLTKAFANSSSANVKLSKNQLH